MMMMMTHPHLAPPTDSPATSSSSPSSLYEANTPSPSSSPSPSQQIGPAHRKRRASGSICRKYSSLSTSPSSDMARHFFTTTPFATPQRRRVGHSSESDDEDEDSQDGGPSSSAPTIIPPLPPEPSDFPGPLLLPPISHLMSLAPTNNHNSDPSPLSPSPSLQQPHRPPPFPTSSSTFPPSAAPRGEEVAPALPLPCSSPLLDSLPHWPSSSSSPATSASLTARSTGTRSSAASPPDSASRVSIHPVASAGRTSRPAISSLSGGGLVPTVPPTADCLPPFLIASSSSSSTAAHAPPSSPVVRSTHDHHNGDNPTTPMLRSSFSEPSGTTLPASTASPSFCASSPDLRLLHHLQQCPPHPFALGQHASYLLPPYMPPESHVHHSTAFPASSLSATSPSPSLKSSASSSPKLGFGYNPFFSPLSSPSPPSSAPHTSPRSLTPASSSSSKGAFFANNTTKTKILPRLSTTSSPVMSPSSTPPSSSPFASLPSSILSCAEPQRDIESMILPSRVKRCLECGSTDTPGWRRGPQGIRTLCNACGLRYARKKAEEKARAALPRKSNIHNLLN